MVVWKTCIYCGGRGHTAKSCEATDMEILMWRLGGLAKDWRTVEFSSDDERIKARESTFHDCGIQLLKFLTEFAEETKEPDILPSKLNTRGIQELFPSLRFHVRIRG